MRMGDGGRATNLLMQILLYCRAGPSAADLCQLAATSFEISIHENFTVCLIDACSVIAKTHVPQSMHWMRLPRLSGRATPAGRRTAQMGPHTSKDVAQLDDDAPGLGIDGPLLGRHAGGSARGPLFTVLTAQLNYFPLSYASSASMATGV